MRSRRGPATSRNARRAGPWRNAPRAALSSPLTLLVAGVTALLSCFLAGAAVLHASAAGGATVSAQAEITCPDLYGPSFTQRGVDPATVPATLETVRRHAPAHGFGEPRVAMYTPDLSNVEFAGTNYKTRLGYTDGGLDQLALADGSRAPGLWMGKDLFSQAGLSLGARGAHGALPPVVGVYQDLVNPAPRWWCSQQALAVQQRKVDPAGGAIVFATDRDSFFQAAAAAGAPGLESMRITFDTPTPATVAEAEDQTRRAGELVAAVRADLGPGTRLDAGTPFGISVDIASQAQENVRDSILPLAALSVLVGLGGIGTVGLQWYQRRYRHVRLHVTRGSGPLAVGGLAVAELGTALLLGGAAGTALAHVLLGVYGPPGAASAPAKLLSVAVAAGVLVLSVLLLAGVVAVRVHREFQLGRVAGGRARQVLFWLPWELGAAALALIGWLRLTSRPPVTATEPVPPIDPIALTYPVFVVLTAGLVAARLGWLLLAASHRARFWSRPALQLAIRRLAGARAPVTGVLVIGVLALGTLAAGNGIADGQRTALETKSGLFVGANSRADTESTVGTGEVPLPEALRGNSTVVGELTGTGSVVLVVDPATFTESAWLGDFDPALLDRLGPPGPDGVPALRVGHRPGQRAELPGLGDAAPVADLTVFPIIGGKPGYVISRAALTPQQLTGVPKWTVLSELPLASLTGALAAADLAHPNELSRQTALDALPFLLVEWTFSFVVVLGAVLAVVAVLALLVAVEVRRRQNALAGALVLRMGMRPRALLRSHLIEHGALAGMAVVTGVACGVAVAAISAPRFDPARWLAPRSAPPDPTLFVLGAVAAAVLVVAMAGWIAVRSVRTARTAELLRA
ncbi:FtsX-like permease family protein [Amycolatopsis albispora]|uniref:Permease n=1 Tax=Amycolatopsis albispora TaxID=1804986 RepID=A0A344L387_9PSEU|nr:FtsX-like permease family protein [Amycolatopsis albispora]AXB42511.1 permease [Amycolatopsis albispora]